MTGGCGDLDGVRFAVPSVAQDTHLPAGHLPDVVAAGIDPPTVLGRRWSTVAVRDDVVEMADGCVAERIAKALIPPPDELGEPASEVASLRIAPDDGTPRPGEQAAPSSPTSTSTSLAAAWPVTRSTRVSAMIWSRFRPSPVPTNVSAWRRSAARQATPCSTGK